MSTNPEKTHNNHWLAWNVAVITVIISLLFIGAVVGTMYGPKVMERFQPKVAIGETAKIIRHGINIAIVDGAIQEVPFLLVSRPDDKLVILSGEYLPPASEGTFLTRLQPDARLAGVIFDQDTTSTVKAEAALPMTLADASMEQDLPARPAEPPVPMRGPQPAGQ